ncbi:hypothetical protein BDY19DRAFT_923181 [Irpex rosettiformis]|uniref:Uncharacterized protein n=1 Tax=Irpex rosettiformis TaxID=378272 RepID=A0ACB8UG31_9APHY|nr:hypothetical protein BDY19DRAFT_923181 [Irpex rosettiformis]
MIHNHRDSTPTSIPGKIDVSPSDTVTDTMTPASPSHDKRCSSNTHENNVTEQPIHAPRPTQAQTNIRTSITGSVQRMAHTSTSGETDSRTQGESIWQETIEYDDPNDDEDSVVVASQTLTVPWRDEDDLSPRGSPYKTVAGQQPLVKTKPTPKPKPDAKESGGKPKPKR